MDFSETISEFFFKNYIIFQIKRKKSNKNTEGKEMDINTFIENFADQFDDTPAEEIKADTNFRDLDEWSSLIALSIIAMVDDEYDVTLKGDDIKNATTVKDIFDRVVALKG